MRKDSQNRRRQPEFRLGYSAIVAHEAVVCGKVIVSHMAPEKKNAWSNAVVAFSVAAQGMGLWERTVSSPERVARYADDVADEEAQEAQAGLPEVEVVVVAEDEGEGLFERGRGRVSCLFLW